MLFSSAMYRLSQRNVHLGTRNLFESVSAQHSRGPNFVRGKIIGRWLFDSRYGISILLAHATIGPPSSGEVSDQAHGGEGVGRSRAVAPESTDVAYNFSLGLFDKISVREQERVRTRSDSDLTPSLRRHRNRSRSR
jgi:hypothetical protein